MDFAAVVTGVHRCRTAMYLYFSVMAGLFRRSSDHIIRIENRHVRDFIFYRVHSASMFVLYPCALSIFEVGL